MEPDHTADDDFKDCASHNPERSSEQANRWVSSDGIEHGVGAHAVLERVRIFSGRGRARLLARRVEFELHRKSSLR